MSDALLMVMRPRNITECVDSIASLQGVDRVDMHGYTEAGLVPIIAGIVNESDHEYILLTGDDSIHTQHALDAVLGALRSSHPVATGWCNLDATNPHCNLAHSPLIDPIPGGMSSYPLLTLEQARAYPDDALIPTTLAGFALTGMQRNTWMRYPFMPYVTVLNDPGWASDYNLSFRLGCGNVPIVAPRTAELHHVKERINVLDTAYDKRLMVGREHEAIVRTRWRDAPADAATGATR